MTVTTRNKLEFLLRVFIIILPALAVGAFIKHKEHNTVMNGYFIDCISHSRVTYAGIDSTIDVSIKLTMNEYGETAFSGSLITPDNHRYIVSRIIGFRYAYLPEGELTMTNFKMQKSIADNVTDEVFSIMFFDTSKDSIKVFLKKYMNGYVISNYFTPMIMCVDEYNSKTMDNAG